MFSSKTNKETETPATTVTTAPVPAQTAAPAAQQAKRTPQRSGPPSMISADLTVTGTLLSAGDMQIDGQVDGDVRCAALVIGEKATIVGEIVAEEVTVRGRVDGSIRARKVQLCATCHVEGNILHQAFAVETGAFFEGNCRHSDNPTAEDAMLTRVDDSKRKTMPSASAARPNTASNGSSEITDRIPPAVKTQATFTPLKSEH